MSIHVYSGDKCPKCGEKELPKIDKDSRVTARQCQSCGYIEEIKKNTN